MFETELTRLRVRIEETGRQKQIFEMNAPASLDQITSFEDNLGLLLPEPYREFVLQVGDGLRVGSIVNGQRNELWMGALFPENMTQSKGGSGLTPFPIQQFVYDNYMHGLCSWDELSSHEKMERDVGLDLFTSDSWSQGVLVLSGEKRGTVWLASTWGGLREPSGLPFLDAFDYLLDK